MSYVRDAQSIIETFDKLIERFHEQLDREAFASVRQWLTNQRQQAAQDEANLDQRLDDFLKRMDEGRQRVGAWRLRQKGFQAAQDGLTKTYARGATAMKQAYKNPSAENFHEWRKRTKYHWHHMRLLQCVWPETIKARRDAADLLSDYLGDDHDLSILRERLLERSLDHNGDESAQVLLGLISLQQIELRSKARWRGARLYAEPPKRFANRLRRYWKTWRSSAESKPAYDHFETMHIS